MMEAIYFSEKPVVTTATRHHVPKRGHSSQNLLFIGASTFKKIWNLPFSERTP
jgi:hypothetical protein